MLRRNPQTGAWERKVGDGWEPANPPGAVATQEASALDNALADTFSGPDEPSVAPAPSAEPNGVQAVPAPSQGAATTTARGPEAAKRVGVRAPRPAVDAAVGPGGAGDVGVVAGAPDLVADVPGLVSGDGQRGVSGAKSVRERLQRAASRTRALGIRKTQTVSVGPRSARPSGPAVKDSTEARQTRSLRKTVEVGPSRQRYVNRPAPGLMSDRPKWVQELFEAHFRSDQTLALRRSNNRMKISRTDYAIGWLTLFDKIREEPAIIRLRDGTA